MTKKLAKRGRARAARAKTNAGSTKDANAKRPSGSRAKSAKRTSKSTRSASPAARRVSVPTRTRAGLDVTGTPALDRLSRRLWAEPGRTPDVERGPTTISDLIRHEETTAFVRALRTYAERVKPASRAALARTLNTRAGGLMVPESAAFLVTGTLALGAAGLVDEFGSLLNPLVQGAFGADDLSRRLREVTLRGFRDWPDIPDGPPSPPIGDGCLGRLSAAAARAGRFVATAFAGSATASVDANGILSLSPSSGSADDTVHILGNFPVPQPPGRSVLFPRAGGGTLNATLSGAGWGPTDIEVTVPEPPGDGPVGFGTASDEGGGGDPTALLEFSEALASCLGPRAAGIGGRLNHVAPGTTLTPRMPIPVLPNDANVFHGGPILVSVSAASGSEPDPAFIITGLNLRNGDTVYLDWTPCTTTFVSATQLTFRVAAMPSGHKLLHIGRQYHRSNGTGFDVRATLVTVPPPPARVRPDSAVTLKGSGFGPDITATVDGTSARVYVVDTHTIEVTVSRPSRAPLASEKRAEMITVEVFDRYVSLGTVPVKVATFRIASFGDSIVWGQGIPPAQRFPMLVADTIATRRNHRMAVFALDHCAHSGAVIEPVAGEGTNFVIPRGPADFTGECPNAGASITAQVNAWRTRMDDERPEIDLVIIDGGINDVRLLTILDPFASDSALASFTTARFSMTLPGLLALVLGEFPAARVVVTGYYPIVSAQSNIEFLVPLLAHVGLLASIVTGVAGAVVGALVPGVGIGPLGFGPIGSFIFKTWLQSRLTARSAIFATTANTAIASAVTSTAAAVPSRRLAFALPQFGPQNAIFAPDAFLYGVTASMTAEDPVAASRATACGVTMPPGGIGGAVAAIPTQIASIGHPNTKGERAYADAIAAVLPSLGL